MIAPETVKKALDAIKRPADYQYFFSQLKSPDWLLPLSEAGFFRNPPASVTQGQYTSFPPWPESNYLARMGSRAPETVVKILLEMPDTENVRVHEDVIEAALVMPPHVAAKLSRKITSWLSLPRLWLVPERVGQLISHYARGGQIAEAIEVARTVFAVFPGEDIAAETSQGAYRSRQDPIGRFDTWNYRKILNECLSELIAASQENGLRLLCDLLNAAVMHRRASDNTTSEDFSYIWRPTIEQDNDRSFGIVNVLVSAVRDAANQICKNEPHKILEVIRILETHQWAVFRRITLHLIRSFPGTGSSEIRQRLTNKELFEENWHEYALLLQAKFSKLSPADQKTILSWIEKGPDLPGLTETASVLAERQPTTEDIQKYTRKWQLQRLVPIREWLVDRWEERYEELATEFGPPKNIHDAPFVITSWVGPTSPLDLNALRSMTIEALVDFLKTWQPSNDHYSPTPEGLGRELAPVVASDPQKFAKHANDFRGLEPTYVRSLLSGFRDAAGQKRTFGWNSVLELCWWVVQQPRDHHVVSTAPLERDTHWGWARKTIAELLEQGFSEGSAEIAFDLRETAWKILKVITEDPEPTPEYEEKYGGSNMDPAHIAINTTRGEAIHAVMYYALWVHRALGRQSKGDEKLASNSFDRMPEVRDVLQRHLTTDPSLGVRSAYGRFFPQLYFLDPDWTTQELYTIFPLDTSLRPFFDAAWTTFILFGTASEKTFDVLQPVYRHAMGFLSDQPNEKADTHNERLVAHLVHYYLWGKLEIDEPHGLLQLFWSKGHAKLRGFIFEYAGRLVADVKREIPETTVQRLKSLWEFRLKVAKTASNPMQYKEELASFGWYFGSGQFDPQWATSQLKEVLRLVSAIDFPKYVVERLAALATTQPQASIECAQLLVESDLQHWEIYGWRNELKTILRIAMQSESARARQGAVDLTHRLGAKGYFEFRELLQH